MGFWVLGLTIQDINFEQAILSCVSFKKSLVYNFLLHTIHIHELDKSSVHVLLNQKINSISENIFLQGYHPNYVSPSSISLCRKKSACTYCSKSSGFHGSKILHYQGHGSYTMTSFHRHSHSVDIHISFRKISLIRTTLIGERSYPEISSESMSFITPEMVRYI